MLNREKAYEKWLDRGPDDDVSDLIDMIYDDFGQEYTKQIQQLEKQVAYWKLSFYKQIEAHNKG